MLSLAAIAGAAAKRARVVVRFDDHHPLNLWVLVVLPSGEGKTPTLCDVAKPLGSFERQLVAATKPEMARLKSQRRILERRVHHLEGRSARTTNDVERDQLALEAQVLAEELEAIPRPSLPRILTEDVTVERLVELLSENKGRLMLNTDEGSVLFGGLMRRSKRGTENLEPLLKAYSGASIRVDRIRRGEIIVHDPALTIGMAVQPSVLRALVEGNSFGGRGLLERFLYSAPAPLGGRRNQTPPVVGEVALREYRATIQWLLESPMHEAGAREMPELYLTEEAFEVFKNFSSEIDLLPGAHDPLHVGWVNKLRGNVARLAGILHVADELLRENRRNIDVSVVERAVAIARYCMDHAMIALGPGSNASAVEERFVLNWIQRNAKATFRINEIHRGLQSRFPMSGALAVVLRRLIERGFLRHAPEEAGRLGRPPIAFEVHPDLLRTPRP